jgi:hypothetical protein
MVSTLNQIKFWRYLQGDFLYHVHPARLRKAIEIKQASALWHINGAEISMPHRVNITVDTTTVSIEAYRDTLQSGSYRRDNATLREAFRFFGGISFVAIGYKAYREDFLKNVPLLHLAVCCEMV